MSEINRIYGNSGVGPVRPDQNSTTAKTNTQRVGSEDQVEISEVAQLLSKLAELPEVRTDKVEQVRAAIARGDYETPDKIEVVVDRILEEFALEDLLG